MLETPAEIGAHGCPGGRDAGSDCRHGAQSQTHAIGQTGEGNATDRVATPIDHDIDDRFGR